ncbi:MAG: hypothetical protein K0Q55_1110, partial [Verrucomicrobia bacterium]|nr:hypothetical protein [Verrucomicrobiota bacterium]
MSRGLVELTSADLNAALETVLVPDLVDLLSRRTAGHCMRITDLDRELMLRLCGALRSRSTGATIVILADEALRTQAPDFAVSSTKLVELRNPLANDELRPPLLVFVPNDLKASAEDSFGVATFEEIPVRDVYRKVIDAVRAELPAVLRPAIEISLDALAAERWPYAEPVAVARFLLTAKKNDFDPSAVGAALYEVGLVPDFDWLESPDRAPARLARNMECVRTITWSTRTERARALDLGLADAAFCKRLGDFFATASLGSPREWARKIVLDSANWPLAFNRWEFTDGGVDPDSIYIGDVELPDIAMVSEDATDPRLIELVGQQVLPVTKNGQKKFSVTFRVNPVPSKVQGLSHFVAEVVSRDNGPTGFRRRKAAWTQNRDSGTISFAGINKVDWEEGWHFVRVYAETDEGERILLQDGSGQQLPRNPSPDQDVPNSSGLFYVLTEEEVDVDPPQRAVPRESSVMHALYRAKFAAVAQGRDPSPITIEERHWVERQGRAHISGVESLEIKLGREGRATVLISSVLADLERAFLADAVVTNRLRVEVSASGAITRSQQSFTWPKSAEVSRLLEARSELFQGLLRGDERLVTQGADLIALRPQSQAYGAAYIAWLESLLHRADTGTDDLGKAALEELKLALSIDTVTLIVRDYRGKQRDALLLGPMHPLRSLWHTTWAGTAARWLDQARESDQEFVIPTRDALLKQLAPAGLPPVVLAQDLGRSYVSVDNLNPFWSVYAASDERDPRGLLGEICNALGVPEPAVGGAAIDAGYVATRIQRYLIQHPYVKTLTINAFNAGRGAPIAEVLLYLQAESAFADLRYDIRLFALDAEAPGTGEALIELLSPDSSVTAREADAFSTPTESHLQPKLRLAIRSVDDFRRDPEGHAAHLSFLFDQFPTEEIRAEDAQPLDDASFVHGLIQPYAIEYREVGELITWSRRPLHGAARPLPDCEELTDLLSTATRLTSVASASAARSRYLPNARPVVLLSLKPEDRALLHQVHEVSDWVLTIDRNLGIEFFDHRRHATRPDYLIDHSPDMANALGHRLAITSRSVTELEALLSPILKDYGLPASPKHAVILLEQLRSLSGRLALKLLSSPNQRAETLGLALSRLFLEHQQVFENQIVVPLDAHLELYAALKKNADELGDEVSFRRTDLALFDLDPASRKITCRLVEVKCYKTAGDLGAYEQLKSSIAEQIQQSEYVIAYHFDPHRKPVDRADRSVKNRDLSALLEFYLDRSARYGLVSPDASDEARYFLRTLDQQDYRLEFTRSALVFDFGKAGTELSSTEGGIEYHRIGYDLVSQLVEAAVRDTETVDATGAGSPREVHTEVTQELLRRRLMASGVPTLHTAAFISPRRDRTATWSELASSGHSLEPRAPGGVANVVVHTEETNSGLGSDTHGFVRPPPTVVRHGTSSPGFAPASGMIDHTPPPLDGTPKRDPQESLPRIASSKAPTGKVSYDILLGSTSDSPQYGILGEANGRRIALDLNQTHTISLFGVQGGGKSYTLGAIAEMASLAIPNINVLPRPLATVIFHYSPTMDYKPEFTSMVAPNSDEEQMKSLRDTYGAEPAALADVVLLVPKDKLEERQAEYPSITVAPLQFSPGELKAGHWKFLMGAVGSQATYIRQVMRVMKGMRDDITLNGLRAGVDASSIPDHLKDLARTRLDFAADYIVDG